MYNIGFIQSKTTTILLFCRDYDSGWRAGSVKSKHPNPGIKQQCSPQS